MAPAAALQKRVELDTVIRFIRNGGGRFDYEQVDITPEEPADIRYGDREFQVVTGDFSFRARHGVIGRGRLRYLGARNIARPDDETYFRDFVIEPLKKKQEKRYGRAAERVILLIDGRHCNPPRGFHRHVCRAKPRGLKLLACNIGCPEIYLVAATRNVRIYP